ncbi:MAG: hypothetical protein IPN22_11375 [Bacteroidetes bacterium]|nr:hypothetical protein [Bacteroidota bacterium]
MFFKGNSDTEVLLYLYQEYGIDFIKELNGMFALFILDNAKCKAWLVRDFFGIKPLFYMEQNKRIYFASELKSFAS